MKKIKVNQNDLCLLARIYDLSQAGIFYDSENLQLSDEKAIEIEKLLASDNWFSAALAALKNDLKLAVDVAAEKERQKYITGGSGQSMTYTEKFNQAVEYSKKWQAHKKNPGQEPEPNENDYLLLKSSMGIDGSTLIEVAETVTYAYAVWQQIGAAIEGARLKAKMAISEAKTAEDAQTIFAAIEWPKLKNDDE